MIWHKQLTNSPFRQSSVILTTNPSSAQHGSSDSISQTSYPNPSATASPSKTHLPDLSVSTISTKSDSGISARVTIPKASLPVPIPKVCIGSTRWKFFSMNCSPVPRWLYPPISTKSSISSALQVTSCSDSSSRESWWISVTFSCHSSPFIRDGYPASTQFGHLFLRSWPRPQQSSLQSCLSFSAMWLLRRRAWTSALRLAIKCLRLCGLGRRARLSLGWFMWVCVVVVLVGGMWRAGGEWGARKLIPAECFMMRRTEEQRRGNFRFSRGGRGREIWFRWVWGLGT